MNTREKLIRIAHANPELRAKLLPLIKKHGSGTEEDISQNIQAFKNAYEKFKTAVQDAKDRGLSGDSRIARQWANRPWVDCMELGFKIAEGVIGTRSIPPRSAKGIEMAYRLYYRSRTMPKDVYKWLDKNEKRLLLTIEAAERWKPKQEGTDDLFTVGPFTVHNTIGAQGKALDAFKKMLELAIKKVKLNKARGFSKVLYGDIYLVGQLTKSNTAAWYDVGKDIVFCRVAKKAWRFDEAHSLVHELGHRYWRRIAAKPLKTEWMRHHIRVESKEVEIPMPDVGDELPLRIKGAPRGWRPKVLQSDRSTYTYERPDGSKGTIARMSIWKVQKQNEGNALRFPTAYSATNEEEHFCEALSLASFGTLPDEHQVPFKAIWN